MPILKFGHYFWKLQTKLLPSVQVFSCHSYVYVNTGGRQQRAHQDLRDDTHLRVSDVVFGVSVAHGLNMFCTKNPLKRPRLRWPELCPRAFVEFAILRFHLSTFWMKVVLFEFVWGKDFHKFYLRNIGRFDTKWIKMSHCNILQPGYTAYWWENLDLANTKIFDRHLFREEIHQFKQPATTASCLPQGYTPARDIARSRLRFVRKVDQNGGNHHQLGIFLICKGPFFCRTPWQNSLWRFPSSWFFFIIPGLAQREARLLQDFLSGSCSNLRLQNFLFLRTKSASPICVTHKL